MSASVKRLTSTECIAWVHPEIVPLFRDVDDALSEIVERGRTVHQLLNNALAASPHAGLAAPERGHPPHLGVGRDRRDPDHRRRAVRDEPRPASPAATTASASSSSCGLTSAASACCSTGGSEDRTGSERPASCPERCAARHPPATTSRTVRNQRRSGRDVASAEGDRDDRRGDGGVGGQRHQRPAGRDLGRVGADDRPQHQAGEPLLRRASSRRRSRSRSVRPRRGRRRHRSARSGPARRPAWPARPSRRRTRPAGRSPRPPRRARRSTSSGTCRCPARAPAGGRSPTPPPRPPGPAPP